MHCPEAHIDTIFFILIDAEQKAHFLFMTRNCHSPDVFVSEPEPETDDEEAHVGYDDVGVQGMSCDDEMEQAADSEDDGQDSYDSEIDQVIWTVEVGGAASDGDISEDEREDLTVDEDFFGEDEMEDDPTVDEDFFGNDEMEDDPTVDEDFFDDGEIQACGVEEEEENEMEIFSAQEGVSDAEGDYEDDDDDAEDDGSDDEITRPARHLRNVVGSDDDGEVAARAVHPPGTMAVFDELAPGDIDNPCEFQIKKTLQCEIICHGG